MMRLQRRYQGAARRAARRSRPIASASTSSTSIAERDRQKLEGRLAQVEVELQEAVHGKLAAESARNVAQDALAKAEVARHKAAEEALNAAKARDQAATGGDDARRELEKLRKKVADLETASKAGARRRSIPPRSQREREATERKLKDATDTRRPGRARA